MQGHQQMHMVGLAVELQKVGLEVHADRPKDLFQQDEGGIVETALAVFGYEHQMHLQIKYAMSSVANIHLHPPTPIVEW